MMPVPRTCLSEITLLSNRTIVLVVLALALPGVIVGVFGVHISTSGDTALFGLSIVAAAFLLAWSAEASEVDIARGVAVAFIALIAVIPEYAVSLTFAWNAPGDPEQAKFAVANMTGGNRLLIGAAWPLIVGILWYRTRSKLLTLEKHYSLEVVALTIATLYSFVLPFKGSISLFDALVLGCIFVGYVSVLSRSPSEEPELIGPARSIGALPRFQRRTVVGALFVYSAASIVACAEPFAHGLVHVGTQVGIDEFVLVQWLAPLASEAPEFVVAAILAWRGRAAVAMGILISAKVNQWTLLVGGLPLAYAISGGSLAAFPMEQVAREEMFLTSAQSAFGVAVLVSLSLSTREASFMVGLFATQFLAPGFGELVPAFAPYVESLRVSIGVLYIVLALYLALRQRREVGELVHTAIQVFKNPKAFADAHVEV
ncbi:MAG: sodium:calcium antiporter [Dehalococcoidia bacterium]|nr:sodium:calcium antiporter [Dehalococcoidia bacterium]